jgi:hypothetical protein
MVATRTDEIWHRLFSEITSHAALDEKQLGHIRHMRNIAMQPDGEWTHMSIPDPDQEWLDALRYQLAHMAYALGIAHFHRLPAAPGLFRVPFMRLISKMLRREVWGYWRNTSRGGITNDANLKVLGDGWTDPVVKHNIMYSGHLYAMVGMYNVLFNEDAFDRDDALTIVHDPVFWGLGSDTFSYSQQRLGETIYWQMVENGWLGVACEPNCVFILCNQYPILGFRFEDIRKGTSLANEVTHAFRAAWDERGLLANNETGELVAFWRPTQNEVVHLDMGYGIMSCGLLNAWDSDLVQGLRQRQLDAFLRKRPDGTVFLNEDQTSEAKLFKWGFPYMGYAALWLSEMGETDHLRGLLGYADKYMTPSWADGGLYYPRNDSRFDDQGNFVQMDRLTGNALLAYSRLNVKDGLKSLYSAPWDSSHFAKPALIRLSEGVDVLRAFHGETDGRLFLTLRSDDQLEKTAWFEIAGVPGFVEWALLRDGVEIASSRVDDRRDGYGCNWDGSRLKVECLLGSESNFALVWKDNI